MVGLGIPEWLRRALMATVAGRRVQAVSGSWAGPIRELLRSVGMGGTPSPLLWALSYDPILHAARRTFAVRVPTFVDDLSGHTCGPWQTAAFQ
eukprot:5851635-Alexandrium_andersonii.AAC.1